ncbi:hypothetical protein Goshw_006306 [Gossypium schwendimanii]|uniref:DUF659 domain-containing protein n=1 Tax=Gossypium schwendimanii TaxID=34291 RepID=A0A7J9N4Y2_GOSSC|nr:hypothetical protein [Gossypium schwendimanii]
MKKGDLLMDQLETIMEKEQVNPSQVMSIEVGQGVNLPTPYEVLDEYLESKYQQVRDWKSVDVSSVCSRDVEFYHSLLDSVIEIGESYIVQIMTDNEAIMKAAGKI